MEVQKVGEKIFKINDGNESGEYFIDGKKGRYKTEEEARKQIKSGIEYILNL